MIKINNQIIPKMPSGFDDSPEIIKSENTSINGTIERQFYPEKKRLKLSYDVVTPEVFMFWKGLENYPRLNVEVESSARGRYAFSGVVLDLSQSEYRRGGDLLMSLEVVIREI